MDKILEYMEKADSMKFKAWKMVTGDWTKMHEEINQALQEGWELYGDVFKDGQSEYVQAMVTTSDEKGLLESMEGRPLRK